jgi:hypothetical protein
VSEPQMSGRGVCSSDRSARSGKSANGHLPTLRLAYPRRPFAVESGTAAFRR